MKPGTTAQENLVKGEDGQWYDVNMDEKVLKAQEAEERRKERARSRKARPLEPGVVDLREVD